MSSLVGAEVCGLPESGQCWGAGWHALCVELRGSGWRRGYIDGAQGSSEWSMNPIFQIKWLTLRKLRDLSIFYKTPYQDWESAPLEWSPQLVLTSFYGIPTASSLKTATLDFKTYNTDQPIATWLSHLAPRSKKLYRVLTSINNLWYQGIVNL